MFHLLLLIVFLISKIYNNRHQENNLILMMVSRLLVAVLIVCIMLLIFRACHGAKENFLEGPGPMKDPLRDFTLYCGDKYPGCPWWAAGHECTKNAGWMFKNCPTSCGICAMSDDQRKAAIIAANRYEFQKNIRPCVDQENDWRCENLRLHGWCNKNSPFMEKNCRKTCERCTYRPNYV